MTFAAGPDANFRLNLSEFGERSDPEFRGWLVQTQTVTSAFNPRPRLGERRCDPRHTTGAQAAKTKYQDVVTGRLTPRPETRYRS